MHPNKRFVFDDEHKGPLIIRHDGILLPIVPVF